ncbi:hypothetical protein [Nonomuraea recticatena]|uniref:Uncharacterized protein n=2 Tax=Nonomuraea recticatena TaxID=46178 RepID=A0ABP6FBU3_9ACTN
MHGRFQEVNTHTRRGLLHGYAVAVLRNEDLREKAQTPDEARYYAGICDGLRMAMMLVLRDEWGALRSEDDLFQEIGRVIAQARERRR